MHYIHTYLDILLKEFNLHIFESIQDLDKMTFVVDAPLITLEREAKQTRCGICSGLFYSVWSCQF